MLNRPIIKVGSPYRAKPDGLVRHSPRLLADRKARLDRAGLRDRDVPYALAILDQARFQSAAYARGFPDEDREEMNESTTIWRIGTSIPAMARPRPQGPQGHPA
jgi:hypothetical protein